MTAVHATKAGPAHGVAVGPPPRAVAKRAHARRRSSELDAVASRRASLSEVKATTPAGAVEVARQFTEICPGGGWAAANETITGASTPSTPGCGCLSIAVNDTQRRYVVNMRNSQVNYNLRRLVGDFLPTSVPEPTHAPRTANASDIDAVDPNGSSMEFGAFQPNGQPAWAPAWRQLAHELCGHGVNRETYTGGPGNRPAHDATIDTENAIAAPLGGPPRGHFADVRQGESFSNPVGDRSRLAFRLTDGRHYEPVAVIPSVPNTRQPVP